MDDLFAPQPTDNLLPFDGQLYDLGLCSLGLCSLAQLDLANQADTATSYDDLYQMLLTTLPWQADIVRLFGKTHITKRQIVWMADEGLSYRYAGHTHQATGWHPIVFHVKQIIEDKIHTLLFNADNGHSTVDSKSINNQKTINTDPRPYFNACLLNYYPSGSEAMGYHADDEKELGDQPLIAALSLGATRKMAFKHKAAKHKAVEHKKTPDKIELYLASGQLIVMAGVTQQCWKHSITKTTKVNTGRISLTFRRMLNG
jgi:alkylated DNA repair dioxygenase AlkB